MAKVGENIEGKGSLSKMNWGNGGVLYTIEPMFIMLLVELKKSRALSLLEQIKKK